jgi:GNAT superfamily N-acetyltransferase
MAIEIRLLKDDESALANNFFNEIYRSHRSMEDFRWEFIDGPKGKAIYVIAVDTDETSFVKVVGIQCAIPLELASVDGKTILTAKSEDTLVHPGYRGQKIFERMYERLFDECRKAGVKYIWGFTPALKAFERLGFEVPFKASQALLVLKPWTAYKHLVSLNPENRIRDKLKIFGLAILSYANSCKRLFIGPTNGLSETKPADKKSTIKNFYSPSSLHFLHQDDAYLNWRLIQHPLRDTYKNFVDANRSEADILVSIRKDVGNVEQIMFASTLSAAEKLKYLRKIVDVFSQHHVSVVRFLAFENNAAMKEQITLLEKLGFVHLRRGNYFVWKSLGENTISVASVFFSRLFTQGIT